FLLLLLVLLLLLGLQLHHLQILLLVFPPTNSPLEIAPATPSPSPAIIYRDNTPVCLVPLADGDATTYNDVACIDYSHSSVGYIMAKYTGSCPKVKLRITTPDTTIYTYDLHGSDYEVFPLSCGSGTYEVTIYENISGNNYSTCLYEKLSVSITDEFSPFLYPNQYVNFNENSLTVAKGAELAATALDELDVITKIYDYITTTITYDYEKASNPPAGYTTNVDEILNSGTGICLDYAAVMTSMLRSQRIPTRLEVGYAQDAYHAWISIYTEETGWLNGIIEFDGSEWSLVDPTFGANTDDETLKTFIGTGSNYILQKMY
ncbi:MAG: transglutaminase domain-containing protein, partial [Lachnospiraceae bacterium]|nr:transglutaminase domain-containing protein [Lachnospiraceae bacterium]